MDIRPDQMISLGYGRYWRSDAIVGLMRIDEDRGPGRRTEVFTANLSDPIVASRSEKAILHDMASGVGHEFEMQELREMLSDLAATLSDIPDVLARSLDREAGFDTESWRKRVTHFLATEEILEEEQNELFG